MIEIKDYNLLGNLQDEGSVLNDFENYNNSDMYACDLIMELADNYVPIYYSELWEHARDIQEYIEEAIAQGLVEGAEDLMRFFQMGYYQFYTQSLYENLDILAFNIVASRVNDFLDDNEENSDLDIYDIEEEIEDLTAQFDNNNKMIVLEEIGNSIISKIKNGEFGDFSEKD